METKYNKMYDKNSREKNQESLSGKKNQIAEETARNTNHKKATVENCSSLNIRKEPNKDGQVICVVSQGKPLIIGDNINGWVEVYDKYGLEIEGYAMDEFVREGYVE